MCDKTPDASEPRGGVPLRPGFARWCWVAGVTCGVAGVLMVAAMWVMLWQEPPMWRATMRWWTADFRGNHGPWRRWWVARATCDTAGFTMLAGCVLLLLGALYGPDRVWPRYVALVGLWIVLVLLALFHLPLTD